MFSDLWIVRPLIASLQMEDERLDDWIASVLPNYRRRQIIRIVHVGLNRLRAIHDAHTAGTKLLHRLGAPRKGRPIQPLISAGETEVPSGYAEAVRTPATWNEQFDEILVRMADEREKR
jgi:hypothetical protein